MKTRFIPRSEYTNTRTICYIPNFTSWFFQHCQHKRTVTIHPLYAHVNHEQPDFSKLWWNAVREIVSSPQEFSTRNATRILTSLCVQTQIDSRVSVARLEKRSRRNSHYLGCGPFFLRAIFSNGELSPRTLSTQTLNGRTYPELPSYRVCDDEYCFKFQTFFFGWFSSEIRSTVLNSLVVQLKMSVQYQAPGHALSALGTVLSF